MTTVIYNFLFNVKCDSYYLKIIEDYVKTNKGKIFFNVRHVGKQHAKFYYDYKDGKIYQKNIKTGKYIEVYIKLKNNSFKEVQNKKLGLLIYTLRRCNEPNLNFIGIFLNYLLYFDDSSTYLRDENDSFQSKSILVDRFYRFTTCFHYQYGQHLPGIFKNNKFRPTDKSTQVLVNNDFYLNKNKELFCSSLTNKAVIANIINDKLIDMRSNEEHLALKVYFHNQFNQLDTTTKRKINKIY